MCVILLLCVILVLCEMLYSLSVLEAPRSRRQPKQAVVKK
jgi:hypothetical protein